jgi:hypothetical protein
MIADRPKHLMDWQEYQKWPERPFGLDFTAIPQLINASLLQLGGIQPVTGAMAKAAGGTLRDNPSKGEVELFRAAGTKFQLVSVVVSFAALRTEKEPAVGVPYAVTLMPGQKRGSVQEVTVDTLAHFDMDRILAGQPCYSGYDPFTGDFRLFGVGVNAFVDGRPRKGFVDELGIVLDQYFLATQYDEADVLHFQSGFPDEKRNGKYNKHRQKLLFTPFKQPQARRVWGAESPIELFLLQELLRRGHAPVLQMLIYDDGATHPSLYDLWRNLEVSNIPGMITEADMFFADQRVAVFCDSTKHHSRAKDIAKDQAINERLEKVGIRPVRVPGAMIVRDLSAAADIVTKALEATPMAKAS